MNLLDQPEYRFLKTDPRLGRNIIFPTYGGSYACQKEDHTFYADFYDLLNDLEKRLEYARQNTSLPEAPDMARIEAFQMEVNASSKPG